MSTDTEEVERLRQANELLERRVELLEHRLEERRQVDVLRRALRDSATIEEVAERGVAYAAAELGGVPCLFLHEEIARPGFSLKATAGLTDEVRPGEGIYVERHPTLSAALADGPVLHTVEVTALAPVAKAIGEDSLIAAGVYEDEGLVGLLVAAGGKSSRAAMSVAAKELSFAMTVAARVRSRAEELAHREAHELEMLALLGDIEQRDKAFQGELLQARRFQQQLVVLPPLRGVKVHAFYEPMGLIGGDLYAVSQHGARIRIFIADATGHGIRASLTTMFIKNGYESLMSIEDPSLVLEELNESIAATYKSSEMLFTASCVDIHTDTGKVALACAGHPPACAIRGGEIVLLEGDGAPMGVRTGMKYDKVTTSLAKGDGLYLHTDGINEAHVEGGGYFGEERLYESIRRAHVANEDVAAKVRAELLAFVGSFLLSDDASLIGVRLE